MAAGLMAMDIDIEQADLKVSKIQYFKETNISER